MSLLNDYGLPPGRLKFLLSTGLNDEKRAFWWDRLVYEAVHMSDGERMTLQKGLTTARNLLTIRNRNSCFNGCSPLCLPELLEEKRRKKKLLMIDELMNTPTAAKIKFGKRKVTNRTRWKWSSSLINGMKNSRFWHIFQLLNFILILFGYVVGFLLDVDGYYINFSCFSGKRKRKTDRHEHEHGELKILNSAYLVTDAARKFSNDAAKALVREGRPSVKATCKCVPMCSHKCVCVLCIINEDNFVDKIHDKISMKNLGSLHLTVNEWTTLVTWLVYEGIARTHSLFEDKVMVKVSAHPFACIQQLRVDSIQKQRYSSEEMCKSIDISMREISLLSLSILTARAKTQLDKMRASYNKLIQEARENERNNRPKTAAWCLSEATTIKKNMDSWNEQLDNTFLAQTRAEYMQDASGEVEKEDGTEGRILKEIEVWTILLEESFEEIEAIEGKRKIKVN